MLCLLSSIRTHGAAVSDPPHRLQTVAVTLWCAFGDDDTVSVRNVLSGQLCLWGWGGISESSSPPITMNLKT